MRHILEDGVWKITMICYCRLLALQGMQENNLFQTKDELVALAYEKQAEEIEFTASQVSQPA